MNITRNSPRNTVKTMIPQKDPMKKTKRELQELKIKHEELKEKYCSLKENCDFFEQQNKEIILEQEKDENRYQSLERRHNNFRNRYGPEKSVTLDFLDGPEILGKYHRITADRAIDLQELVRKLKEFDSRSIELFNRAKSITRGKFEERRIFVGSVSEILVGPEITDKDIKKFEQDYEFFKEEITEFNNFVTDYCYSSGDCNSDNWNKDIVYFTNQSRLLELLLEESKKCVRYAEEFRDITRRNNEIIKELIKKSELIQKK